MKANTLETFWRRIDTSGGPDSCWPWIGHRMRGGYGRIRIGGQPVLAHRLALSLALGRELLWNDDIHEEACHHCDNPPCCNPAHLYVGNAQTNRQDCARRGRVVSPLADANAAKTHCPKGHEFTPENTYWHDGRHCRTCRREADRRYRARRRAA